MVFFNVVDFFFKNISTFFDCLKMSKHVKKLKNLQKCQKSKLSGKNVYPLAYEFLNDQIDARKYFDFCFLTIWIFARLFLCVKLSGMNLVRRNNMEPTRPYFHKFRNQLLVAYYFPIFFGRSEGSEQLTYSKLGGPNGIFLSLNY